MSQQDAKPDQAQTDPAGCCGETTAETEQACPCTTAMKKHPWAAAAACATMGLLLLTVNAGAILGIIAFFRTL